MVEGDKWEMYIPSELAYGARGSPPKIGPDNVLIFRMEIISIDGASKPGMMRFKGGKRGKGRFTLKNYLIRPPLIVPAQKKRKRKMKYII
jgi:hypothetical protein